MAAVTAVRAERGGLVYHAYAAIAALCGAPAAEAETGAPLPAHAARLAAALGELLAENAALRVIAAAAIR